MGRISPGPTRWPPRAERRLVPAKSNLKTQTYDFTGQNVTLRKEYPKSRFLDSNGMFFGTSAPKIGGVLMITFAKPSFTHFFQINGPRGGGGLPDFTRCGTNYLHTPLLKKYPKTKFLGIQQHFFLDSAPPK